MREDMLTRCAWLLVFHWSNLALPGTLVKCNRCSRYWLFLVDAAVLLKNFLFRIVQNALTACPSLHQRLSRCARSGLHRLNLSTALSGRRVTYYREFVDVSFVEKTLYCDIRQLFGEDEDGTDELDEAEKQGENGRSDYPEGLNVLLRWRFTQPKKLPLYAKRRSRIKQYEVHSAQHRQRRMWLNVSSQRSFLHLIQGRLEVLIPCRFSTRTSSICYQCLTCGAHVRHQHLLISLLSKKGDFSYNDRQIQIRVPLPEVHRSSTSSQLTVTRTERPLRRLRHLVCPTEFLD